VEYVGVEPLEHAAAEARRLLPGAQIMNEAAYDVRVEPAHAVVSFSVLEHVVDRRRYMTAIRANLRPDGRVYFNYDSGHFVTADLTERVKARASQVLARLGSEARYRAPVLEDEFARLLAHAGLRPVEAKSFNTDIKRLFPAVPSETRDVFMERWLAFELALNDLGIAYRDELASILRTRNFVLEVAAQGPQ
jgi:Methyltransferase domain